MSRRQLKAALVGLGKIGFGYADDPVMARHFKYATHAQVLADHPAFEWLAVVDPNPSAREIARTRWKVPHVLADARALGEIAGEVEVLVIATPPETRGDLLDCFPRLRAVLVEKPLGLTLAESSGFLERCGARNIAVQVNFWRRADVRFRALARGELRDFVGETQCAFVVYGNGLKNNGTHMVDFVRMLLGEVVSVESIGDARPCPAAPITGDLDAGFVLNLTSGANVVFQPVRFPQYRENGLDVWGHLGRFAIYNEGLTLLHYARADNRAMSGERELVHDAPQTLSSTVGEAFYHMFTNLSDAVQGDAALWSPGESALRSSEVIEAVTVAAHRRSSVAVAEIMQCARAS